MSIADWGLLLVLSALWGGSFYFYKVLVAAWPPFTIVCGRVVIAAFVLVIVVVVRRSPMPRTAAGWGGFLVLGLLNNVIPYALIVYGETRIASGLASILNASTPMFTLLVARFTGAEGRITPAKLVGLVIGFLGVGVLVGPDALSNLGSGDTVAELAVVGASISYAFAAVFGRRFRGTPALSVAAGQQLGSSLVALPLCLLLDRPWSLPPVGPDVWGALLGLAIPSTALAYLLYFRILARAGATNASLVTLLVPVSAVILGALLLDERLGPEVLLGMGLIAIGLLAIDGRLLAYMRGSVPAVR